MARRSGRQPPTQPVVPAVKREAARPPAWLRPAILAVAALALMGWFSTAAADSDTWWHLKTGQYIVRTHALPVPDPFSFTTYMGTPLYPGEESVRDFNLKFEWLAEVLTYLVWAAAGFPGVILIRAAMLSLFAATSGAVVFHRTGGLYRALAATGMTAFCTGVFTSDRPYQFTNLFLAATLLILERRRGLWLLPPVFLIWSNCHAGYILGFAALGAHLGEGLFLRWRGRAPAGERKLWLVSAACFLASGINPNGFRALTILSAYRQSGMVATLFEWQRPLPWPPTMIGLLLAAALGVLIRMRAQTRAADWLLLVAFAAAYFSAVRNTPFAGLIAPWVMLSYLSWKWAPPAAAAEWVTAGVTVAALLAELAAGRAFQLHPAAWKYPSGAADFLLAHHIAGPMFNSWEKGGYLLWRLWPEQRVFIDGRTLNESVFRDYQRMVQYAGGSPGARE
ncbi:MAG TPA: hypothetical protein VKJ01_16310, partial [Candidatus Solibacter sp.]|nr:hypothetical protein [Candidatus Solibacter sp.]